MSWGAQNRSEDAKTPSVAGGRSDKPEPVSWPVQPYGIASTICNNLIADLLFLRKCHAPAQSLFRLGPRSWVFAPAFLKSKLKNAAVCPVRTAFGRPLRCCMALRGARGTQEGSGCTSGGACKNKSERGGGTKKKERGGMP
jgi:hypothetical protein